MRRENPPQSEIDAGLKRYREYTTIFCLFILIILGVLAIFPPCIVFSFWEQIPHPVSLYIIFFSTCMAVLALILWSSDSEIFSIIQSVCFGEEIKLLYDPWPLDPEEIKCSVKTHDGEPVKIALTIFIPKNKNISSTKERIRVITTSAIARRMAGLVDVPSFDEIEQWLDEPYESVARELRIPVLYPVIHECSMTAGYEGGTWA
jgi:hypothetical protein